MSRTRIKFCGMTSPSEIALAVAAGADALGIIVSPSPRRVAARDVPALLAAVPPFARAVLVCAGETDVDLGAFAATGALLQFSGDESPDTCERAAGGRPYLKAFHVRAEDGRVTFDRATLAAYAHAVPLFDSRSASAFGGTGYAFDWDLVAEFARERPIVASGGLNGGNVGACVATLRPYAVDVRSGIETDGRKDAAKMRAFVAAVRAADDGTVRVPSTTNVG